MLKMILLIGAILLCLSFSNLNKETEEKIMEEKRMNLVGLTLIIMIFAIITIGLGFLVTGCTYSITMVHTEGTAADVVDETATNTPSTSVTVPVSVIPKSTL